MRAFLLGALTGAAFGIVLYKVGATRYSRVMGMLTLRDTKVMKFAFTAIGVASLLYGLAAATGVADKPTLKDDAELQKQLEKLKKNGYDPSKTVISYCHVGLGRGSFQYLALRHAGVKNVKVYVGSWGQWGEDPSLPLAAQP